MITLHSGSPNEGGVAVGAETTVRHAHYYDAALHRAITETGADATGRDTLERAAASAAYRSLAGALGRDPATELAALFASTGLGTVTTCQVGPRGADLTVAPSAFARARLEMFGRSKGPACDVARGVIAGSLGALVGSAFSVREVECVAAGAKACRFVADTSPADSPFQALPRFEWPERPPRGLQPADTGVELLPGDSDELPGPTYGRLWAELYARATYDFEQEIPRTMGPKFANLASVVLTEAAHLGTFYSVGGLVRSPDWNDRVVPLLPTREEWVAAIVRLVETFGWGSWEVQLLDPDRRFTVHVHDGYEALSYLAMAEEPAPGPRCYFARGFVAALMNVLFAGDVFAPAELNQSVYNTLFRNPTSFRAIETRCVAMGDPYCEFVANPLSPGLR